LKTQTLPPHNHNLSSSARLSFFLLFLPTTLLPSPKLTNALLFASWNIISALPIALHPLEIAPARFRVFAYAPPLLSYNPHNTIIEAQLTYEYCRVFITTIRGKSTIALTTCSRVKNLQPRTGKPEIFSLHTPNACESDTSLPVLESASHQ
jgi:hypothetical protein